MIESNGWQVFAILPELSSEGEIECYVVAAERDGRAVTARTWNLDDWYGCHHFMSDDEAENRRKALASLSTRVRFVPAGTIDTPCDHCYGRDSSTLTTANSQPTQGRFNG